MSTTTRRSAPKPSSDVIASARLDGSVGRRIPVLEALGAVALGVSAWIHVDDFHGHTGLISAGYIASITASLLAAGLLASGHRRGWQLAVLAAGATLIGFLLSWTIGLRGQRDDIGNWREALGVYSVIAEGTILGSAIFVWLGRRRNLGGGNDAFH